MNDIELRDHFAGLALSMRRGSARPGEIAEMAYAQAQEMINERNNIIKRENAEKRRRAEEA